MAGAALGGEDAVAEVYKAWLDVSEFEANQIDASTATKAVRRHRAADARLGSASWATSAWRT